ELPVEARQEAPRLLRARRPLPHAPGTCASARSTAASGVGARSTPSISQPGSTTTTGRPSLRAKPISASVPQLPPTAITASPLATTARFRACPDPRDDDVIDPLVRAAAILARQDPDRRPARGLRAAAR